MSENNIKIGYGTILDDLLNLTFVGLYVGYFLKFYLGELYFKMEYNLINICVTISLIVNFYVCLLKFRKLLLDIIYFGHEFTKKDYEIIKSGHIVLIMLESIINTIATINAMILVIYFVPFKSNNCHGYSINLCFFPRFASFCGVIFYIVYGLILLQLLKIIFLCLTNINLVRDEINQMRTNIVITYFIDKKVIDYILKENEIGNKTFIITV